MSEHELSIAELIDCGVLPTQAKRFAAPLAATMARFGIRSLNQRAAFIAQCVHESAGFTQLEENLRYRSPERLLAVFTRLKGRSTSELLALCRNPQALAAAVYGGLNGNAPAPSADAWRFRGSGLIQLTGRRNFLHAEMDTGRPYLAQPELVRTHPEDATLTAGLFWEWNHCNRIIDEDDFDGVSKVINLGNRRSPRTPNGNAERRELYDRALDALRAD